MEMAALATVSIALNAGNMPGMQWHASHHTNSLVPFYANGDAARLFEKYADQTDLVRGRYIDNTEIGKLLQRIVKR